MAMSLTSYRAPFLDRVLDLLWRQWSNLGVGGQPQPFQGGVIDPEALLLTTCTFGRHDARLFDAMIEWTGINGRYVNVQRCKRMLGTRGLSGAAVFRALADTTQTSNTRAKWGNVGKAPKEASPSEPLFFLKDGRPMPLVGEADPIFTRHGFERDRYAPRGVAQAFRPERPESLLLRLRALLGVNARCEIFAYLLVNGEGSPREIARRTDYFPATVANALSEMRDSGFVVARTAGRRRVHRLVPAAWGDLLLAGARPTWRVWPPIFGALEALWALLRREDLAQESELAQASALRRVLLESVVEPIEAHIPDVVFGDVRAYSGEALIPHFIQAVSRLLDALLWGRVDDVPRVIPAQPA